MDVVCKFGVVNCCDESPDYELSESCYKAIRPLDTWKEKDIGPQINADEHG